MKNFLYNYGWIIALTVAYVLYLIRLNKTKGKAAAMEKLRADAYNLMLQAEKKWGRDNGTGSFKFDWVTKQMYNLFPETAKMFIDEIELEKWLQELYEKMKDKLDDGVINGSIR